LQGDFKTEIDMKTKHFFIVLAAVAVCFTACKKDEKATPVTGITLNYEGLTLIPGETATLIATVQPDDATNKTVTWTSSKPEVVTVNEEGLVTAVANGEATIIAITQDGNEIATCIVIVDYRSQWVGDWEFTTGYVYWEHDLGVIVDVVFYHLGKISLGNASNELNIEYMENRLFSLNVDKNGKIFGVSFPDLRNYDGKFDGDDKFYLYLNGGGLGGGSTHTINGIKKEGDKK